MGTDKTVSGSCEDDGGGGGGGGGGVVVVVGVKFDVQSRELLTWSLMKMAQPGDRVIALHVLDSGTVKTFDSFLAVYEGFCNLKQVDLKLKVCRGESVRKTLVREAKASGVAKLIVGTSKTRQKLNSSTSTAKYCAKKLSKSCSVCAVRSGKILFQREASVANNDPSQEKSNQESRNRSQKSKNKNSLDRTPHLLLPDDSGTQVSEESCWDGNDDNSWALVPIQTSKAPSNSDSNVSEASSESKKGWSFLRRVLFPKQQRTEKAQVKRLPVVKWVFRTPTRNSSSVVHPDQKQNISLADEDQNSNLEVENYAIVPMGPEVAWTPISPCHDLNGIPEELKDLRERYSSSCRLFSYEELAMATSNFIPENLVGKGGSSHVYKGCLPDGKELAVKILKPSEDVLKEFIAEIEIITTLHHKNIISLFGFCFEHNKLLLVYDLLSRGSLEENLHGEMGNALGWRERYKVAVGVAEALDYLHNCCDQPVIHKDVKSSNILLSDDFEPQLSDFGLACWASTSCHTTCTDVAGTFGYLAPEYFMYGKVSDKVDVFAFGVVLLELLSGRKPINSEHPKGQESLVMWAKPILEGGKCFPIASTSRPQMSLVLKLLQGDEEVKEWARHQVCASEEHDAMDGETFPINIQSHLNLALLDVEDDSLSISSTEQVPTSEVLEERFCAREKFPPEIRGIMHLDSRSTTVLKFEKTNKQLLDRNYLIALHTITLVYEIVRLVSVHQSSPNPEKVPVENYLKKWLVSKKEKKKISQPPAPAAAGFGGKAYGTAYRWRKLRKTEDRVRALQERLRKLVETQEGSSSAKSVEKRLHHPLIKQPDSHQPFLSRHMFARVDEKSQMGNIANTFFWINRAENWALPMKFLS
ncbi:CALCIUM/CALMODULIN-REGULATED RECEPTOR-LIKE KINASE 2 [Salix purpurea]|uniref:CALCIUM/CALMODULIN-REGULATED RECEPTOR-LIKE KINASE 2 n=1 Tax=Salix purpurea TaxID=77065 RepID=A0A9Q0WZN1_SALPP|nr:CALCIUM/CALMODULIN-REGULATED RECEPTOR-LIKE KINASE 2 [Salix purpurea]